MRVALIIDTWFPHIGGGQINAWEITKRIAKDNIFIDIITRDNGQDLLKLPKNVKVTKLGSRAKPHDYLSKAVFLIRSFFHIYQKNYDLVHAHAFLPGIAARLLMVFRGIAAILTVHGSSLGTNLNNPLANYLEKFILAETLYSAQITVSQDFKRTKNVNKKIIYIPNGVEITRFDKVKSVKFKDPTILFVGRLHKQKNLQILIKSINLVKFVIPDIMLIIVGKGPEESKLRRLARSLNMQKNIKFFGEITGLKLIKLYKSSRLFILTSVYEGQPLTLLEAWAAKIPVIVPKTGDCKFLVKDGVNGYVIKNQYDPQEIAQIIKKALSSKNLEKLGQNGYNLVKENFSWERSAQETLKLYESLTSP